jgi:hypothetical protein
MDYSTIISEIFTEDEYINNNLDKDLELFLDANPDIKIENVKIKAYKTSDELDDVYQMIKTGFKIAKINKYKNPNLSTIIFLKV